MKHSTENLWSEFGRQLKTFIHHQVKDESATDDILQEVFIKIHSNINSLNDQSKVRSWIYQISRNQIIDYFRRHQSASLPVESIQNLEDETPDDFMQKAIEDMIEMMAELPAEYCQALCMTEIDGMNQKAYAEKVGISYSGAKSRVQRARKMLKDMLMNCCHYQFDVYGTVVEILPKNCCCCQKSALKH